MQNYRKAKIFVSGGAGVIGTELVEKLLRANATVFVGDLKPKPKHWKKEIAYRQGDLNGLKKEELRDFQPEYYFHLAATFEQTEESIDFWEENYHHNIALSHHLLDIAKDCPTLKKIIFASSYLVYDPKHYLFKTPPEKPTLLTEKSALAPRNLCGMAKLYHEKELEFIKYFHKSAISARIFRSFGKNSKDVISRWIRQALQKEKITVYNPEGAFDYIFAEDVAEGLFQMGALNFKGVLNLGSGKERRISDVIDILKSQFSGLELEQKPSQYPYEASKADMTLFHSLTGWKPKHTLESAMLKIIDYERQLQS